MLECYQQNHSIRLFLRLTVLLLFLFQLSTRWLGLNLIEPLFPIQIRANVVWISDSFCFAHFVLWFNNKPSLLLWVFWVIPPFLSEDVHYLPYFGHLIFYLGNKILQRFWLVFEWVCLLFSWKWTADCSVPFYRFSVALSSWWLSHRLRRPYQPTAWAHSALWLAVCRMSAHQGISLHPSVASHILESAGKSLKRPFLHGRAACIVEEVLAYFR